MDSGTALSLLVSKLQLAYSGELAAAVAYRGHSKSVNDPEERERIREIENEEWHHRELVGEMLRSLKAGPRRWREVRAAIIGHTIALFCRIAPWFPPMYGAGRLESRNIQEYEDAAVCARDSGHAELVDCLLQMAEVEWEHEHYFRGKVEGSRWSRYVPVWAAPPPKESIRARHPGAQIR